MTTIDYVALVAGIFTIISVPLNVIQLVKRKGLMKTLKSRSQAAYNYFSEIASFSDRIRGAAPENSVETARSHAHLINGITDAARLDIISYSREHLGFIPKSEHPARPFEGILPKPKKKGG